jgi:hypothetical protein
MAKTTIISFGLLTDKEIMATEFKYTNLASWSLKTMLQVRKFINNFHNLPKVCLVGW